jgi:hypothetical protein
MDDNDNRLFGVTAQIAWTPKPAYQLIVRTPLYAVRNLEKFADSAAFWFQETFC